MSIRYNITAGVISELGSENHFPRACSFKESSEIRPANTGAVLLERKQTLANTDHEGGKMYQYGAKIQILCSQG